MPLLASEKIFNANVLLEIAGYIAAKFPNDAELSRKLHTDLIPFAIQKINAADLHLNLDSEQISLRKFLENALFLDAQEYALRLEQWMQDYRLRYAQLATRATQELQQRVLQVPRGLVNSWVNFGMREQEKLGDDDDARVTLQNEIVLPEEVRAPGIYILPAVLLVAGPNASQDERAVPYRQLQVAVNTVCKNNPAGDITLLMQGNNAESHWQDVTINIKNGQVASASLWDSLASATAQSLRASPAFENLRRAVQAPSAVITTEAAQVQTNGFSCLDYCMQHSLRVKYAAKQPADPAIAKICAAEDDGALRTAVLDKIVATVPSIAVDKNAKLSAAVQTTFATAATEDREQALEEDVYNSLHPNDAAINPEEKQRVLNVQIKFDEMMARKLAELYAANAACAVDEAKLIKAARLYAFKQMQQAFGFFKPAEAVASKDLVNAPPSRLLKAH